MNISLSYNWIKEYIKTGLSAQEFAREFSLHSQTIDRVREMKPQWKKIITAKIINIEKHPNADKLRLATVDTGSQTLRVVCGALNIVAGQIVPLVLEGGEVLGHDGKLFTVKKANIRGTESNGMLCSKRELGLGDDHSGIFILPKDSKIGVTLESIFPLGDSIFDIEVTSNRPDCMSVLGISMEASAIFKKKLQFKESKPRLKIDKKLELNMKVLDKKLCFRYQAAVVSNITVEASPLWMQARLMSSGIRPINNIVDITNYVLLEYGQPLHAFDYDKLSPPHNPLLTMGGGKEGSHSIEVRKAKTGESIHALDGNTYSLIPSDLVIADSQHPIAVAGVMGGEDSSVTHSTKTIVFESAVFDPVSVRKTSRRLHLVSQSSNIFEKGVSPKGAEMALFRALELAQKHANGRTASKIFDIKAKTDKKRVIFYDTKNTKRFLGIDIGSVKVKKILQSLGCAVSGGNILKITPPWWREQDLKEERDIVEEIARIYGYHNLPSELPQGALPMRHEDKLVYWENYSKKILEAAGLNEVYTYSLVSKKIIEAIGLRSEECLKLYNPLSSDFEYLRPTLLSSILSIVSENQEKRNEIKIFEISRVYIPKPNELPEESAKLAMAFLGGRKEFFECKGIVGHIFKKSGMPEVEFKKTQDTPFWRSQTILDVYCKNEIFGKIGMVHPKIAKAFDIKKDLTLANIDFAKFAKYASNNKTFVPLPEFPAIERDLALVCGRNIAWESIEKFISHYHSLIASVEYLSTYTGQELGSNKSIALRITFQSKERTLISQEIDDVIKSLVKNLQEKFNVNLR